MGVDQWHTGDIKKYLTCLVCFDHMQHRRDDLLGAQRIDHSDQRHEQRSRSKWKYRATQFAHSIGQGSFAFVSATDGRLLLFEVALQTCAIDARCKQRSEKR